MSAESRLTELGLELPAPPPAAGSYVPTVQTGRLLYCAGTLPLQAGKLSHKGKAGREHDAAAARKAARVCALNTLANIRAAVGSLDRVSRVVMVNGFVNAVEGFAESPGVINGASDLLVQVFGEAGRHARAAVAVSGLPLDATVEIQVVVELAE